MKRILHELIQGSPEWHQFRLEHDGASEAAPALGLSKKVKRNELLHAKHTGIAKEFSDFVQERILNHGHEVEALARPMAEAILGEQLFPVTYSYGRLSASSDGLTMDGTTSWEHKQWATELAASVARGELPEEHQPQCQQTMLVNGSERVLFMVSDGTPENCVHMFVHPDAEWFERIQLGWAMFHQDLADYQPVEVIPAAVAAPTLALPALSIQVKGSISLVDNLKVFGERLESFIAGIDKDPTTDQAFADAESAIKTLGNAETALEAAKSSALAQTASIDEMTRTVALYAGQARTTRLMLEKLVKAKKESIRFDIVGKANAAFADHIAALNKRLGKPYMPTIAKDFQGVIKGKKTVASLHDAVDTELARVKIEANAVADKIGLNLNLLREQAADYPFLFADAAQIVLKEPDDLAALVKVRIAEHKAAEEKRLEAEREKIRAEEQRKAQAEAEAKARQEQAKKDAQERESKALQEAEARKVAEAQAAESARLRAAIEAAEAEKRKEREKAENEARAKRDAEDAARREVERQQAESAATEQLILLLQGKIQGQKQYAGIAKAIDSYLKSKSNTAPPPPLPASAPSAGAAVGAVPNKVVATSR